MGKNLKGKELGTGLYQRPDGRYEAKVLINGVKIDIYNFNLKQLKEDFEKAKLEVRQGISIKLKDITLDEWFSEWFTKYKLPTIKQTSVSTMKGKYKSVFGCYLGDKKIYNIRNMDIQEAVNKASESGKATSSIRCALSILRKCLESAKNNRIISFNPCFEVIVPYKQQIVSRRFLTQEEQNKFLRQVEYDFYREMYYIMFLTGMRIGEIGALAWEDINFEKKHIYVRRNLSCIYAEGEKILQFLTPKTQNGYRIIPFMGEAEEMLLSQRKKQKKLRKELGKGWCGIEGFDNLVFTTLKGSPVTKFVAERNINNIVKKINEQELLNATMEGREFVEFEKMHPHVFRHTFCSRCFEKNMSPKIVQILMGHANYSTTIDIYTHVTSKSIEIDASKFGSALLVDQENL